MAVIGAFLQLESKSSLVKDYRERNRMKFDFLRIFDAGGGGFWFV